MFSVANPREVWLITVAHAVNEFYSVALPPILPLLVNDFAISYGEAGALLTVFFATYSIFQLPAGVLADRIGQRWLLAVGMVVLAAGILVAAGAQNYWTLVVAEIIAGVGGSTYHPSGMSLISDLENDDTEGKAMGIHGFGGVVGTALAPALVGGLAALVDWRLALTVSAAVGITYALVFLTLFPDIGSTEDTRAIESDGGTDTNKVSEKTTDDSTRRWSNPTTFISVPLERWVAVLFLANLAIATEIGAVRTFITSYLVEHMGLAATVANGIFFMMLVGAGISSLGAGTLADAVDRQTLGVVAMGISTVILGATVLIPPIPIALFIWFFLLGIVMWAALPTMNAITSEYSERSFSGSLFGVMLTAGSLGGAVGPLLFGVVAEQFGMGMAFPFVASVSTVGTVAFLAMRYV
ncbi:MFS transporter [Haladaptatus pallidirubidus]|uniref:MFS transporter n=1 Tax=Haladaptatus pallidirubidus TaxID=1008152 RepID=A0AAV3UK10_9EURY|nr:MFS transporter [Haladaptatus pallidirubidus]